MSWFSLPSFLKRDPQAAVTAAETNLATVKADCEKKIAKAQADLDKARADAAASAPAPQAAALGQAGGRHTKTHRRRRGSKRDRTGRKATRA